MSLYKVENYLRGSFRDIEGWCIPHLWQTIGGIQKIQEELDVVGPVAEIGVYHGKFLIGLINTKETQKNYAIDVFSMQQFNLDGAGLGNLEKFKSNVAASSCDLNTITIMERDSLSLTTQDLTDIRANTGGFSMFSIDGCHTVQHTISDTKVAMELTASGGIIFVDDYNNINWPGVHEGICKLYLTDNPLFVPLAATCNKLILCHLSFHAQYLDRLKNYLSEEFPNTKIKEAARFGYDAISVIPDMASDDYLHTERT